MMDIRISQDKLLKEVSQILQIQVTLKETRSHLSCIVILILFVILSIGVLSPRVFPATTLIFFLDRNPEVGITLTQNQNLSLTPIFFFNWFGSQVTVLAYFINYCIFLFYKHLNFGEKNYC